MLTQIRSAFRYSLFFLLLNCSITLCKAQQKVTFTISGNGNGVSGATAKVILVSDLFNGQHSTRIIQKEVVVSRQGKLLYFDSISAPHYLRISFDSVPVFEKENLKDALWRYYQVSPGDSVRMNISKKSIDFSGKGSAKYNCFVAMDLIGRNIVGRIIEDKYEFLKYCAEQYDSLYRLKYKILQKYSSLISRDEYELISMNLEFEKRARILKNMRMYYVTNSAEQQKRIAEFFTFYRDQRLIDSFDSNLFKHSISYADYQSRKMVFELGLLNEKDGKQFSSYLYKDVYAYINSYYKGDIQENMFVETLLALNSKKKDVYIYWDSIKAGLKNPAYQKLLDEKNNNVEGTSLFNYSLEKLDGTFLQPSELNNAVVLYDFWFTGCTPCAELKYNLSSLKNANLLPKQLKIVSVCVDEKKERWKESVQKGVYTSKDYINVYSNGLGYEHPFPKRYSISIAPYLILVDKGNKIVKLNVPRPYGVDAKSTKEFIALLEKQIAEK